MKCKLKCETKVSELAASWTGSIKGRPALTQQFRRVGRGELAEDFGRVKFGRGQGIFGLGEHFRIGGFGHSEAIS